MTERNNPSTDNIDNQLKDQTQTSLVHRIIGWLSNLDLWKGFFGWFIANTLLFNLGILIFNMFFLMRIGPGATIVRAATLLLLTYPVNIIGLIILHRKNHFLRNGAFFAILINILVLRFISSTTNAPLGHIFLPFFLYLDYFTIGDPFRYVFPELR